MPSDTDNDRDVAQSGSVTPGHLTIWTTDGVIRDAGTPATPSVTGGLGITSSNQVAIGINNALNPAPYNQLGFGITLTSAQISVTPYNGAAQLPLNISASALTVTINGIPYPFNPSASGNLTGPLGVTSGDLISYNGTSGNLVQDSGLSVSSVVQKSSTLLSPPVANVAALRSATSATLPQTICYVQGYYANADGGEGEFFVGTTTTANGGTIINDASGRSWYRGTEGTPLSVKWFGAKGDATTDDTAAFQSAVTAAVATKLAVSAPGATYLFSSAVTVAGATVIHGVPGATVIKQSSLSVTSFRVTTNQAVSFEGLTVGSSFTPQTSGAGIVFDTGSSSMNFDSRVTNCVFQGQLVALSLQRCAAAVVRECQFTECITDVLIQNLANEDGGDNTITACTFGQGPGGIGGAAAGQAVSHISGGGLRFINNKVNGHAYGYVLNLNLTAISATSDLIIIGNSFENMPNQAIQLQQAGPNTNQFFNIIITDNQFANLNCAVLFFESSGATNPFSNFIISDNVIQTTPGGVGISLHTGVNGSVGGNFLVSQGGTQTGILTGGSGRVQGVVISADNEIVGYTTPIDVHGGVRVEPFVQSGSVIATTANAYGSLFSSAGVAVVFDTPYVNAPKVTVTATSGAGAVSGLATSVTATGFTVIGLGVTNTTDLFLNWMAAGN